MDREDPSQRDNRASAEGATKHDNEALNAPLLPRHQSPPATQPSVRQRVARSGDVEAGTPTNRNSTETSSPRILDRNATFFQSRGRWSVQRLSRNHTRGHCCSPCSQIWREWVRGDWFHRLAYSRTGVLMATLFLIYTLIVVFFGFIYRGVSVLGEKTIVNPDGSRKVIAFCDMDINDHMEALYFSLSTMTTIGYGVSDYYFGGCWTPLLLVLWQVCTAITFDAVAVGLLFHRISRGRKRGRTIAFSNKAVVQCVKGVPYLMFRLGELRRYHLIGAKVHCFCIRHERLPVQNGPIGNPNTKETYKQEQVIIDTTHFVTRHVPLLHPDEDHGSPVWMGLPQVIVHKMDEKSPLIPPGTWYDCSGSKHDFPTSIDDKLSLSEDPLSPPHSSSGTLDSIEQFLSDRDAEIVVLVEGTDEGTGAATQARHSYKVSDLEWNHTFVPCMFPVDHRDDSPPGVPACSIDFSVFHDTVPAPNDCDACAYVPQ